MAEFLDNTNPDEQDQEILSPEEQAAQRKRKIIKETISWAIVLASGVGAALILSFFVIVNAYVPSGSMLNTIEVRSRIVAFRLSYLFSEPERGDIIVFRCAMTTDEDKLLVKRIIALPGETIQIIDGRVYINGEYLDESVYVSEELFNFENMEPLTVLENSFFVMGDNRSNSDDSRRWPRPGFSEEYGFVSRDAILGRVIFSYFPSIRVIR